MLKKCSKSFSQLQLCSLVSIETEDQEATPMLEDCNIYSNECDKSSSSTITSIDDDTYRNKDSDTPQLHFEIEIDSDSSEPFPRIPHYLFIRDLNKKMIENEIGEEYGWFVPTDNDKVPKSSVDEDGLVMEYSRSHEEFILKHDYELWLSCNDLVVEPKQ